MITAQFCVSGNAKQAEIVRAFGVTEISVKRAVKRYRQKGPGGFYEKRKTRGAGVLTAAVIDEAQRRLDEGQSSQQIATALGLKKNTLDKAIRAGRLHPAPRPQVASLATPAAAPSSSPASTVCSKSERSRQDSQAEMGMGATNMLDRVAASLGMMRQVPIRFQPALDVTHGGVLWAVPAGGTA